METNILVLDGEGDAADLIESYFVNEGLKVYQFDKVSEALHCIDNVRFDLAVIDTALPESSSLSHRIRERFSFPMVLLRAKEAKSEKQESAFPGAEECISKPFRPLELIAHVKAQLRHYKKYNFMNVYGEDDVLTVSGLVLRKSTRECTLNGKVLALTPTEFAILWYLCVNRGRVVSSEELFRGVWGEKCFSSSCCNTVMVHIRHLREKMGEGSGPCCYIKTVWRVGYRIQ